MTYYVYSDNVENSRFSFIRNKKYEVKNVDKGSILSGHITDEDGHNLFILFGGGRCAVLNGVWEVTENKHEGDYIYLPLGTRVNQPAVFTPGIFYKIESFENDFAVYIIDNTGDLTLCIINNDKGLNCAHTGSTTAWTIMECYLVESGPSLLSSEEVKNTVKLPVKWFVDQAQDQQYIDSMSEAQPYLYEVNTSGGSYYIKAKTALDFYGQIEDFTEVESVVPLYE